MKTKAVLVLFGLTLMFFQISLIIVHHNNIAAVLINLFGLTLSTAGTIKAFKL